MRALGSGEKDFDVLIDYLLALDERAVGGPQVLLEVHDAASGRSQNRAVPVALVKSDGRWSFDSAEFLDEPLAGVAAYNARKPPEKARH